MSKKDRRKARRKLILRIETLKDEITQLDADIRDAADAGVFTAHEKRTIVVGLDQAWHTIERPSLAKGGA